MKQDEFISWAKKHGWTMDRWGHLRKDVAYGKQYRFKLSRIAARYEVKSSLGGWIRIRSNYFKNLYLTEDDKLAGMKR